MAGIQSKGDSVKLVHYWRTAHQRNSVRALGISVLVSFGGGIWSALPNAFVDRLPLWLIFAVPCAISALGLLGAYTKQASLEGNNVDAK
jgi:hypothetical protein